MILDEIYPELVKTARMALFHLRCDALPKENAPSPRLESLLRVQETLLGAHINDINCS